MKRKAKTGLLGLFLLAIFVSNSALALPIASASVDVSGRGLGVRHGEECTSAFTTPTLVARSVSFAAGSSNVGFDRDTGAISGPSVFAASSAVNGGFTTEGNVQAVMSPAPVIEPRCASWFLDSDPTLTSSVSLNSDPLFLGQGVFGQNMSQLVVLLEKSNPNDNRSLGLPFATVEIGFDDIVLSGVNAISSFNFHVSELGSTLIDLTFRTPTHPGDDLIVTQLLDPRVIGAIGQQEFDSLSNTYTIHGGGFRFGFPSDLSREMLVFRATTQVTVPEPPTVLLIGLGLAWIIVGSLRRIKIASGRSTD